MGGVGPPYAGVYPLNSNLDLCSPTYLPISGLITGNIEYLKNEILYILFILSFLLCKYTHYCIQPCWLASFTMVAS